MDIPHPLECNVLTKKKMKKSEDSEKDNLLFFNLTTILNFHMKKKFSQNSWDHFKPQKILEKENKNNINF